MARKMDKLIEAMDKSAAGAFDTWDTIQGVPHTSEERVYDRLTQDDFMDLMQQFGPTQTAEYIKAMELRRLHRK